jgi:hypothetical protein
VLKTSLRYCRIIRKNGVFLVFFQTDRICKKSKNSISKLIGEGYAEIRDGIKIHSSKFLDQQMHQFFFPEGWHVFHEVGDLTVRSFIDIRR